MNTKKWSFPDKFLSKYRTSVAAKYIEKDDVVLDLGCGVQHYLLNCFKNKFGLGFGLDYDIENYQEGNLRFVNYKFQGALPFKEYFFNKVFLIAVLEHIEEKDVPGLFGELFRILKNGGRIIITTPPPRTKRVLEFIAFKLKLVIPEEVTDHKHYYIGKEISDLARANGLKVVNSRLFQFGLNSLYVLEK